MDRNYDKAPFADDADDHERDPAIGQSKGASNRDEIEGIEGENTVEGDVENDSTHGGGADPVQLGRTNK